ncbi:MAG: murein hydrolase activator EnvC family protein [Candidatus Limnocylindrales bacterium]
MPRSDLTRPRFCLRVCIVAALLCGPLLASSVVRPAGVRAGDALQGALAAQRALQSEISAQRQEVARLQEDAARVSAQIAATEHALTGINVDQASVQVRLARATASLAAVRARYLALVAQMQTLDAQVTNLGSDLAAAQQQLAGTREALASDIGEAYLAAQTPLWVQLVSAHSLLDVLADVGNFLAAGNDEAALAGQIAAQGASIGQLLAATEASRTGVEQARLAVSAEQTALTGQQRALAESRQRLAALAAQASAERAAQVSAAAALGHDKAKATTVLSEEEAALGRLQNQISALLSTAAVPSAYNGTLAWPMEGAVTQEFGCTGFPLEAPLGNCAHFHLGIDIAAPMDTPVRAAAAGVVLFEGPNPYDPPGERAWIVIIAHSQHLATWYAHLDDGAHAPLVAKGQEVQQGQIIGYEGNTGISTGPHLLWMVQLNGQFVNPRLFVP